MMLHGFWFYVWYLQKVSSISWHITLTLTGVMMFGSQCDCKGGWNFISSQFLSNFTLITVDNFLPMYIILQNYIDFS